MASASGSVSSRKCLFTQKLENRATSPALVTGGGDVPVLAVLGCHTVTSGLAV